MSRKKISSVINYNFGDTWHRITGATEIKTYKNLAEIVGVTQPAVTKRAEQNIFPIEWAYWVANKYNLNLEWILTGEGEARRGGLAGEDKVLAEVVGWVKENSKNNDSFKFWFLYELEQKFPDFAAWRKRKDSLDNESTPDLFNKILRNNAK